PGVHGPSRLLYSFPADGVAHLPHPSLTAHGAATLGARGNTRHRVVRPRPVGPARRAAKAARRVSPAVFSPPGRPFGQRAAPRGDVSSGAGGPASRAG